MMAKEIPMAKPQPIWKMLPKAVTPRGEAALRVKVVMAAIPGKLGEFGICFEGRECWGGSHVEEDACGFSHAFSQPSGPGMLEVELPLRYWLYGNNVSRVMLLDSLGGTNLHFFPISTKLYFKVVVLLTVIGLQPANVRHLVGGGLVLC